MPGRPPAPPPSHDWRRSRGVRLGYRRLRQTGVEHYVRFTMRCERVVKEVMDRHYFEAGFTAVPDVMQLSEGRDALAAAHDAHLEALNERNHQLEDWIDGGAP